MSRLVPRLPATLAAAGLLLSIYLEVLHVQTYLDPGVSSICAIGERLDCDTVALSSSSVLFGVPVALWGAVGFAALLFAALRRTSLLLPLAAVAATASVAYFVVSVAVVGSICIFCEAAHVMALVLLWAAWRTRDLGATRAALRSPGTLALGLGAPALVLGLLHFLLPPYWTLASWEGGHGLAHGVDEEGRPWIGAEDPELVVHEHIDYHCPHCRIAHGRMRVRVAENPDSLRIVRHQYPRMRCRPSKRSHSPVCHAARIAICAGEQGKFWEADDWLVSHAGKSPRIDEAAAARAVGLDARRLGRCTERPETFERVDRDVVEARQRGIQGTPAYRIDGRGGPGRLLNHEEADAAIDERL